MPRPHDDAAALTRLTAAHRRTATPISHRDTRPGPGAAAHPGTARPAPHPAPAPPDDPPTRPRPRQTDRNTHSPGTTTTTETTLRHDNTLPVPDCPTARLRPRHAAGSPGTAGAGEPPSLASWGSRPAAPNGSPAQLKDAPQRRPAALCRNAVVVTVEPTDLGEAVGWNTAVVTVCSWWLSPGWQLELGYRSAAGTWAVGQQAHSGEHLGVAKEVQCDLQAAVASFVGSHTNRGHGSAASNVTWFKSVQSAEPLVCRRKVGRPVVVVCKVQAAQPAEPGIDMSPQDNLQLAEVVHPSTPLPDAFARSYNRMEALQPRVSRSEVALAHGHRQRRVRTGDSILEPIDNDHRGLITTMNCP